MEKRILGSAKWMLRGGILVAALSACTTDSSSGGEPETVGCMTVADCTAYAGAADCRQGVCVGEGGVPIGSVGGAVGGGAGGSAGTSGGSSHAGGTKQADAGGGATAMGGDTATGGISSQGGAEQCPPCAAPPDPACVGSGPCGCGPYTCPEPAERCGGVICEPGFRCCGPADCGHCIPEDSDTNCRLGCGYCDGGIYERFEPGSTAASCPVDQPILWVVNTSEIATFQDEACTELVNPVQMYCCTEAFEPTCPGQ